MEVQMRMSLNQAFGKAVICSANCTATVTAIAAMTIYSMISFKFIYIILSASSQWANALSNGGVCTAPILVTMMSSPA